MNIVNLKLVVITTLCTIFFSRPAYTFKRATESFARRSTIFNDNGNCNDPHSNSKFAIIIHGWRQNCETEWVETLGSNLEYYRGGCIMCMDYSEIGKAKYFYLLKKVEVLADVLRSKLTYLENLGYLPHNGYLYGFSFGARIAIMAGILYGSQKLGKIDACDMAGPGFDFFPVVINNRAAAKNVQCIHTSNNKGTWERDCHQNWNMGFCGKRQMADGGKHGNKTSHGLCNDFYNLSFEYSFYAERYPKQCRTGEIPQYWPSGYKMGYKDSVIDYVRGDMYSSTWKKFPYNQRQAFRKYSSNNNFIIIP